jgi:hypothetical protein
MFASMEHWSQRADLHILRLAHKRLGALNVPLRDPFTLAGDFCSSYPRLMVDRTPTTQDQAIQAQEALREIISFEEVFGPPGRVNGKHLRMSIGVTANAPDYQDHFIQIVAPLAVDVSRVPSEVNGVRVVIVHEYHPGFRAL